MLKRRQAIDALCAERFAARAAAHLLPVLWQEQGIIAGYSAIRGEMDMAGVMAELKKQGRYVALPVVDKENKALIFKEYAAELVSGSYGIAVPALSAKIVKPMVLLVPLLAFDRKGHRLGYGAGYYDRAIAALRADGAPLKAIGIAYACQEITEIPVEPHDEMLDAVVTEQGIRYCNR